MPAYDYRCVNCLQTAELLLEAPPASPQFAGECEALDGGPCEMHRMWIANYGIGFVNGAGFAPARTTLGDS